MQQIRYKITQGTPDQKTVESAVAGAVEYLRKPLFVRLAVPRTGPEYNQICSNSRDSFATFLDFVKGQTARNLFRISLAESFFDLREDTQYRGDVAKSYTDGLVLQIEYSDRRVVRGTDIERPSPDPWRCLCWIPIAALDPVISWPEITLTPQKEPANVA